MVLSELDASRNERVLGSSVDVRNALEDGGDGEDGRGGDLEVVVADGLEQVLLGVVNAGGDLRVALGVGGP